MKRLVNLVLLCTITLSAAMTVSCEKTGSENEAQQYTITVTDDGNGTAEASETKAVKGTEITLEATPAKGYLFGKWTVVSGDVELDDETAAIAKFTMPEENVTLKAEFIVDEETVEHYVTVTNDGNGTGTATPARALKDAEITLTSTPAEGYMFSKWTLVSGDTTLDDDTAATTTFTMPAENVTVRAEFVIDPAKVKYDVTVTDDGNGTGTATPAKAVMGTEITLRASAKAGYLFSKWTLVSGDATLDSETSATAKFTMPEENVTVKAEFTVDPDAVEYDITVTNDGNGTGVATPSKAVRGAEVTLVASPTTEGYLFYKWTVVSGDVEFEDETAATTTFKMPMENVTVKAEFETNNFNFITDSGFRSFCNQFDTNKDSFLSRAEAEKVRSIDIMDRYEIKSVKGIEVFTNLVELWSGYSGITELDLSKNLKLESVECEDNGITSLTLGEHPNMRAILCVGNSIAKLDVSKCPALKILECQRNMLPANELRKILSDLPVRAAGDGAKVVIRSNSGSMELTADDLKVAQDKNWTVTN